MVMPATQVDGRRHRNRESRPRFVGWGGAAVFEGEGICRKDVKIMTAPTGSPGGPSPFMTVRTAVILLASFLAGFLVGGLDFLGGHSVSLAVLAGLAAAAATVLGVHNLLGD